LKYILKECLKQQENKVNLVHIESRLSKSEKSRYEFFIDCKAQTREQILAAIEQLKEKSVYLHILNKSTESEYNESGQ